MKTLIKGGTIVTATDKYVGDILIDGDSGILATSPSWERPQWKKQARRLEW